MRLLRNVRIAVFVLFFTSLPISVLAQSQPAPASTPAPTNNAQAIAILTQSLNAVGGVSVVAAVQDFTGTGNITYNWAGEQVSGTVTVRGLGTPYFRLDAQLPQGTRTWFVTGLIGGIENADGTTQAIPYSNAINLGSLTFPYAAIAAALNGSSASISTAGTTTVNGRQGTIIQIQQTFSPTNDPTGELAALNTKSYVIDSQTYALLETQDTLFSDDGRMRPITHEVIFSNFNQVNGLSIPFSVTEQIGGQQTWSLTLNSLSFNTGLTPGIFQF